MALMKGGDDIQYKNKGTENILFSVPVLVYSMVQKEIAVMTAAT
ncbi:hypothetical protein HMPREF9080_01636 [Cardiobacterium valvarum F0432]|uniref:Uncharacterized protein n=1 Tax=Cardiobacterium valvarum F0432 TaxID=797473 RepID=G9ZFT8_9GAMM|nr:hypothetical protein HMPREF9080_01636 [Cardiobacterium valvarum F0432]